VTITHMSHAEWNAEGSRRFGADYNKWKFVCPICAHVQAVEDFRQFKDRGATPDSARCKCIGRYIDGARQAFGGKGKGPCDYAGYGLFQLSPLRVNCDDGSERHSFAFADEPPKS
jgi:hypothetical protein